MVGEEVLRQLRGVEGTQGLCGWVEQFVSPRDFEVSWDGRVRGRDGRRWGSRKGPPSRRFCFLSRWRPSYLRWKGGLWRRCLVLRWSSLLT